MQKEQIDQLFVSLEHASLAKHYGFDDICCARYNKKKFELNKLGYWYDHNAGVIEKHYISAPLKQQLRDWFHKKYNLYIEIYLDGGAEFTCYRVIIYNKNILIPNSECFTSGFHAHDGGAPTLEIDAWRIAFEDAFDIIKNKS